ncbi:MAG: hypothetical protein JZU67_08335, partial [Burkholderiaceae bacterium]|nr:hypothetical protein [Burkholderiaceae bacterium]
TISSLKLYPPLCGTYTIGGTSPDFANFSEPVEYLNYSGITCPVVFKVRNGTYNTEIEINQIMGATAANRVTFESESGDSSLVILQDSTDNPVIYLNGAGYVNVKQM